MPESSILKDFKKLLGAENVLDAEPDRLSYAYDSAVLPQKIPAAALMPERAEQIGEIAALCHKNSIPMTVRGSGTNLSGGTIPDSEESVVILTQKLNRVLEINSGDLYAVVEPGVVTANFAAEAAARGLFYPPDPGSQAVSTIGGNIAENAGGLRGLKYGVTKDYVMGLEFFDSAGLARQDGLAHGQMRHGLQSRGADDGLGGGVRDNIKGDFKARPSAEGVKGDDGGVR